MWLLLNCAKQRTATLNRIRSLLGELDIVLPLKAATIRRRAYEHLEDLPGYANTVSGDLQGPLADKGNTLLRLG